MSTYSLPRHGNEEWRPAKELDFFSQEWRELTDYYASDQGRLCHFINGKYHLLKMSKDKDGYFICYIGKKRRKVHRIIASTFVEVPQDIEKAVVDHIDAQKTNNNVSNLRWVTFQENTQSAYDKGLIGERRMMKILAVDKEENAVLYKNQRIASEATGVDGKSISQVVRGLNKSASGYRFVRINNFKDQSS